MKEPRFLHHPLSVLAFVISFAGSSGLAVLFPSSGFAKDHTDLVFATVGEQELKLNLFLPEDKTAPPLVVFIHGGGWKKGSYQNCKVDWLVDHGFAVASISYRFSQVAIYPAQIHDCKGAIRWLRAHASKYGYDSERIGVAGSSAGGQLALLLGTTHGIQELEGEVGGHLDQSSQVHAVVNYYGASDFVLRSKTQPSKTEDPNGSVYQLLGGKASQKVALAKLASAAWQVTDDDAPLLIFHGMRDKVVLLDQAERIRDVYEAKGLPVEFVAPKTAGHGSQLFFLGENRDRTIKFFQKHLISKK